MTRFDFAFSRPLSWPLALLGVTPWTAHVEVTDDEFAVRFGPWSLVTPLSNVEGAQVTGPYLPFKVLGPHISLADRGVTFGTTWRRGVCVRFHEGVPAALPGGLLRHPAVTVTVADAQRLVDLLERRPSEAPGDDELQRVLQPVPAAAGQVEVTGAPDVAAVAPTPVARRPLNRTTTRNTPRTPPITPPITPSITTDVGPGSPSAAGPSSAARRSTRRSTRLPEPAPLPEHPTPADMPAHTSTEKVPGVTPPADEGLPGPDEPHV